MARFLLLALASCSAVGAGGCGGAVGSQADLSFQLFREEGLGGDAASLVMIVSPFSCGLFGADLRRIRALGSRIGLTLVFVADTDSPSDSIQVAKTALSFGLGDDVPYVILDEANTVPTCLRHWDCGCRYSCCPGAIGRWPHSATWTHDMLLPPLKPS